MDVREYAACDAVGLARLVREGHLSAGEVAAAAVGAIERVQPRLNALAGPLFDRPLTAAADGGLAGVPFLLKDDVPIAKDVAISSGTTVLSVAPPADRTVMARYRAAGLRALGLTATPELCISFATETAARGTTNNPWSLDRGVGGSSGGAAALVAAGAVPVAHGSDGAGSIRVPAASCGVVGLKPSRGRVPVGPFDSEGLFGLAYDFALTRTVRDTATLLDLLQGEAPGERYSLPAPPHPYVLDLDRGLEPLRVGVWTDPWSPAEVAAACAAAAESAARLLELQGCVVTVAGPRVDSEAILVTYEGFTALGIGSLQEMIDAEDSFEAVTRAVFADYRKLTPGDVLRAMAAMNTITHAVADWFTSYDLLVTPTVARSAIPHRTLDYDAPGFTTRTWMENILSYGPFTAPFNVSGHPAISLPLAMSADGLPIGVQLVARHGREDVLIRAAAFLERAAPWAARRPPVHAAEPTEVAA